MKLLSHPVAPHAVPGLSKKPWAIQEPAHTSALDTWQKLQKSHKRPGLQALSINQWFLYNVRYILAGDLDVAWAPFGGLSAQFNHVGIVLDLAVTEHAGVALSYDLQVGNLAKKMAETDREKNKVEGLLSDINQTIENNCLRESGIIPTYTPHKTKNNKGDKDKGKGDKTPKGTGKKNDRSTGKRRDKGWETNMWGKWNEQPKTWKNDWSNNWPQNTHQTDDTTETQQETETPAKAAIEKSTKK